MLRTTVILATGAKKVGREQGAMTPIPVIPVIWMDPLVNSKSGIFIVRVVIFGLDGAPALRLFDFFQTASHETPTLRPFSDK